MRHHGSTENADGDEQAGSIQPGHQASKHQTPVRPRQQDIQQQAAADGQDQGAHHRFQFANAVMLQYQNQHHVECRHQHARNQRYTEQQVQGNRTAQQFGQIAGDDRDLAQQPQRHCHRPRVVGTAGLCQVQAPGDTEPNRKGLKQHGDQIGGQQHPQQLVPKPCAAFEIGGPVAGVHVAYADDHGRPGETQQTPTPRQAHVNTLLKTCHSPALQNP